MERGVFRGHLDDEQRIVFSHVLAGKSGREIAAILGVRPSRIENIVRKTCRQLGADGRKHAASIIASHSSLRSDRQQPVGGRWRQAINHNGCDSLGISAKSARIESAPHRHGEYVRDVGSNGSSNTGAANIFAEIARFLLKTKPSKELKYVEQIMLLAAVVLSATLALSALVATMQGFDKLINS